MKTRTATLVAIAAAIHVLGAAAPAFAEDAFPLGDPDQYAAGFQSTRTRADVQAEARQAQADGSVQRQQLFLAGLTDLGFTPQKTRAQVVAELEEAGRNGDVIVGDSYQTLHEQFPHLYAAREPARALVAATGR